MFIEVSFTSYRWRCCYSCGIVTYSFYIIIAGEWNGLPYESHKFVITGSTPVLQRLIFHPGRNLNRKKEKIIVLITKKECVELQKLGHKFGSESTLHHTYRRKRKKYYLTESEKAMADLEMIRKSHIIEK